MILPILQAALTMAAALPQTGPLKDLAARVETTGWTYQGASDKALVYQHGGPSAGMIWVRFEYPAPEVVDGRRFRSDAQLRAYDCSSGSYQILQRTPFSDNNLSGSAVALSADEAQTFPSSGPLAAELRSDVCSGAQ